MKGGVWVRMQQECGDLIQCEYSITAGHCVPNGLVAEVQMSILYGLWGCRPLEIASAGRTEALVAQASK